MRPTLLVLSLLLVFGCAPKTPEEQEAAKYPAAKMMTESEVRADATAHPDPRQSKAFHPQGVTANPGGAPVTAGP